MTRPDHGGLTGDLFEPATDALPRREPLCPGAMLLRGFTAPIETPLLAAIDDITREAPLRHMTTPGGFRMSAAMTNCGAYGWITDRSSYRYEDTDPASGRPWPRMPEVIRQLARDAAGEAGFEGFEPDACLVNRYQPGARLSLHQDRDEQDFTQPIVSVSLGIPAVFLFGGLKRKDKPMQVPLTHGDVVVWGGPARLRYHGVKPLAQNRHPVLGECRINLTLRRAVERTTYR